MKRLAAIFALLSSSAIAADTDLGRIALMEDVIAATNGIGGASAPTGFVACTNILVRPANGAASYCRVTSGGTLSADSAKWPDGASVLAVVVPAGPYSVSPSVSLVGYGSWPTGSFQMAAWRVGPNVLCSVISEFAAAPSVTYGPDGAGAAASPSGWTYLNSQIVYQPNGNSVDCILGPGETLSASSTGWTDGQSVLVAVHPAGAYSVSPSVSLVGYGSWPTGDFFAVVWRVGSSFYANIVKR